MHGFVNVAANEAEMREMISLEVETVLAYQRLVNWTFIAGAIHSKHRLKNVSCFFSGSRALGSCGRRG